MNIPALELVANIVLLIIAVFSAFTDARYRKIFNVVTYPGIIFGFVYHSAVSLWFQKGLDGFLFALFGFLLGFGFFFLFYLISKGKKMGAGDVKLYGAIGACLGFQSTLYSLVVTALMGLLLSIILLFPVFYRIFKTGSVSVLRDYKNYPIPYGTVIGISIFIWFLFRISGLTNRLVLPFYL